MSASVLAAIFVLGLLAALLSVLKRIGLKTQVGSRLRVVEQIALGPGKSVSLVQAGERVFLVGCAGDSVSLLAEMERVEQGAASVVKGSAVVWPAWMRRFGGLCAAQQK